MSTSITNSDEPALHVYRFRAECWGDVEELLSLLGAQVKRIESSIEPPFPDVEVTLTTRLSLDDVRHLMLQIADGHVMVQTVADKSEYTGIRNCNGRDA